MIRVFVLFAGCIGTMFYLKTVEKIDLVREDYYQKELEFQTQIKKLSNTVNLKTKIIMTYLPESSELNIVFPTRVINGEVKFFRPRSIPSIFNTLQERQRCPKEPCSRTAICC